MLAECYGLTQDPFRLSPDPKFCYRHANFAKAKAYMEYVLHQGEGFVMVTGQPGTGKTLLIADLLSDPRTAKVAKAHIRSTQVGAEDSRDRTIIAHIPDSEDIPAGFPTGLVLLASRFKPLLIISIAKMIPYPGWTRVCP